jgi:glyoxylase-like metal-dependent hydrolase (beta-lactamase superfamily II)
LQLPNYEVYAIKYAERTNVKRADNFVGGDPHDGPMPMDYYLWLIRDQQRVIVVDTGFDAKVAAKRKRTFVREPRAGLAALGVNADDVREIIITHMHNDHVGTFFDFPNAVLHIQDEEMAYATGRYMKNTTFSRPYEIDHVVGVVRLVFKDRVVFHKGDEEIAPGLHVHHIGGHTAGLQAVRVHTQRGWMVLASDAAHYYENIESRRCFPTVFNLGQMADGYEKLNRLADSPRHIIPGHDPLVLKRYPPVSPALAGAIARLDLEPLQ